MAKFPSRRGVLLSAASALAMPAISDIAWALDYPTRPITMIVPFPPGGATDTSARVMGERMRLSLGQPIVIENLSGANGTIGLARTARAAPDGYTIDMGQFSTHIAPGAIYDLRYDTERDFEPIGAIGGVPLALYARKDMPGKDLRGLIAWLKDNPGKATHGNVTVGAQAVAALFQRETGTQFQSVPYRGEGPAIQDLLAGHIDLVWSSTTSMPYVQSGGVKAYVVTAKARLSIAPDVPTAAEAGLPAAFTFPSGGECSPQRVRRRA